MSIQFNLGFGSYIMQPYSVISYDARKEDGTLPHIEVGKYCSIAQNCTFVLAHHNPKWISTTPSKFNQWNHGLGNPSGFSRGDITIQNDVWIGVNSTIMDGICIGNGAAVASGSVVTKNVPSYAIVGGNPCKVIRYRFSAEQIEALENIRWWDRIRPDEGISLYTEDIDAFISHMQHLIKVTDRQSS